MHPVTRTLIDRAPRRLRPAVELTARTIDDAIHDRVPGLAAEVAFYVILSLPPLLLTAVASIGFIDEQFPALELEGDLVVAVLQLADNIFTTETISEVIEPFVRTVASQGRGDIALIGFLITLYAASRAVKVVLTAITIAYDLEETRPGWMQRIWSFALTLGGLVLVPIVVPLLLAGPDFGASIARWVGTDPGISSAWRVLYWPAAGVAATLLIASLFHLGAPWKTPWHRDLPGAALAMLAWVAGSVALRTYARDSIVGEGSLYGPIAGPLVLLLWLYISAFAVLLGAELNAEIEKLWPTRPDLRRDPDPADRAGDGHDRDGTDENEDDGDMDDGGPGGRSVHTPAERPVETQLTLP